MEITISTQGKTVLYVRVSTAEQTSDHQVTQAREAGYVIEDKHVIVDHGVSGVKTKLDDRDQGKRLKDLCQPGDTLLVRWVNRLGRNYEDVKGTIEAFNSNGVTVKTVINGMIFEADCNLKDPTQKAARAAVLAFMAAISEAEETAKREARAAGIKHAKAGLDASTKYRGKKPSYSRSTFETVQTMLAAKAMTVAAIARECDLSRQTVIRIRDHTDTAEAALTKWGV